jgi:DNA-binding protein HU-beta
VALELITQGEWIADLAERSGWSASDVRTLLSHMNDATLGYVRNGYRVKLPGGVIVGAKVRKATKKRQGRNPATGEAITIAAKPASAKLAASFVKPFTDLKLPSAKELEKRGA